MSGVWGFIGLYVRHLDPWLGEVREPIVRERCWKCDGPHPDLAHMVMEYVAAVLGTELERRVAAAIEAHIAEHRCTDGPWFGPGGCDAVGDLVALLPDAMVPIAIG